MDEAIDGLKERVSSLDRRLETVAKETQDIAKDVSAAKGSVKTLTWVLGILVPLVTVALTMVLKHFGL
jgi:tetrahydromethanopterin S-methyltransferase subunit G